MTLRVSGKNLDIGKSLRQHVLDKVQGMVAHYFNGSVGGHVVIYARGIRLSVGLHACGSVRAFRCTPRGGRTSLIPVSSRRPTRSRGACGATSSVSRATRGSPAVARAKVANYMVEPPLEEQEEPAEGFNPVVVAEGTETLEVAFGRFGGGRARLDGRAGRRV